MVGLYTRRYVDGQQTISSSTRDPKYAVAKFIEPCPVSFGSFLIALLILIGIYAFRTGCQLVSGDKFFHLKSLKPAI